MRVADMQWKRLSSDTTTLASASECWVSLYAYGFGSVHFLQIQIGMEGTSQFLHANIVQVQPYSKLQRSSRSLLAYQYSTSVTFTHMQLLFLP